MVIEDNHEIREIVCDLLRYEDWQVASFDGASRALEFLEAGPRPGVILLDLMLRPDMNGWQFLEVLRQNPRLADIPVIAMTGGDIDRGAAREVKAQALLQKPFDVDVLTQLLDRYCPREHRD